MTPIRVNEPVTSFPRATLLAAMLAGRYRPGQHRGHDGFLQHAFAASPWLGATVLALVVLAGLVLALVKAAGRALDGTPWYMRLALLAAAGFGISRVINRRRRAAP